MHLELRELALAARAAGRGLARAGTAKKNAVLERAAREVEQAAPAILEANAVDVRAAEAAGIAPAMLERLRLDAARISGIARSIRDVAALPDPVGRIDGLTRRPNGLSVGRMFVPLGLVAIVYESRPNVTAEAASLCIKSGNAVILRGGSEASSSSRALVACFSRALAAEGEGPAAVTLVPTIEREAIAVLATLDGIVDLLVPRGGEALVRYVLEHATVPVLQHAKGVCHLYVDADADLDMAERIAVNAKVQRPGVCNALETLLVDSAVAVEVVPRIVRAMQEEGVEVRGCERTRALAGLRDEVRPATEADWDTEFLALVLAVRVVDDFASALAHIERHGTRHTAAIVTRSYERAQRFLREVDASLVLVNASTRFNDGGELGLGAELGISTTKLHAFGPMGLEELCAKKWIAYGDGQIRG